MVDHASLIREARALSDEKGFTDAAALLEDHLSNPDCAVAYADIAQLGSLGDEAYQRVHHAIRHTSGLTPDAYLTAGLYDALSLFEGAKPKQGVIMLRTAEELGAAGSMRVLGRWASPLMNRKVEDRYAWAASLAPLIRGYPHLALFMAATINANTSPASGGNEARPDEDQAAALSLYAPTVFPKVLRPLLLEVRRMQRAFGERHWLGMTLGATRESAKRMLRLMREVYGGKVHYPGGYGLLVRPENAGEIMFGFEDQSVDFIGVRHVLTDKSLHDQVIDSLWSAGSHFKPFRCGSWDKDRENWRVMRAAAIVDKEAIDCRFDYWTGSAAGAAKNPNMMTINWVDVASAEPWHEELVGIIENSTLDLEHAGLPSVKRREGLLPLYKKLKNLLEKFAFEKTAAWLTDYAKSNPDEPGSNMADGLLEQMAAEFPSPKGDDETLCHVRFDGEIIEDDDAYASLLAWYFEAARDHVEQPRIKSRYDSKARREIISFTHRGKKREMSYSHKSDWVSTRFMKQARKIVSDGCEWRYVALGGDDLNLQVFVPNEIATWLTSTFYELHD